MSGRGGKRDPGPLPLPPRWRARFGQPTADETDQGYRGQPPGFRPRHRCGSLPAMVLTGTADRSVARHRAVDADTVCIGIALSGLRVTAEALPAQPATRSNRREPALVLVGYILATVAIGLRRRNKFRSDRRHVGDPTGARLPAYGRGRIRHGTGGNGIPRSIGARQGRGGALLPLQPAVPGPTVAQAGTGVCDGGRESVDDQRRRSHPAGAGAAVELTVRNPAVRLCTNDIDVGQLTAQQ